MGRKRSSGIYAASVSGAGASEKQNRSGALLDAFWGSATLAGMLARKGENEERKWGAIECGAETVA